MNLRSDIIDFTMGADPELCCAKGNSPIQAYDYCYSQSVDEFGADGNETTFEVRPRPSLNPLQIVSNIKNIFEYKVLNYPALSNYKWLAGGCQLGYPLGGHIHFGLKNKDINTKLAVSILSQYVGSLSLLLEDPKQAKKRRNNDHSYGYYDDYRDQPFGFEYRSMSSWLTSPYIAAAFLCLAKVVMFDAVNNKDLKIKYFFDAEDFNGVNIPVLKKAFPNIWREITQMALYPQYKEQIDLLYRLIKANKTWFPKCALKEAWGIVPPPLKENKIITLDSIWEGVKI